MFLMSLSMNNEYDGLALQEENPSPMMFKSQQQYAFQMHGFTAAD